jgi:solute carrier family 25 uncoupling protein 8/9
VSTLVTAPMDMIKTRLMLQRESKTVGNYKNGFHCAYQVSDLFVLSHAHLTLIYDHELFSICTVYFR